jgi:hypothetical protein
MKDVIEIRTLIAGINGENNSIIPIENRIIESIREKGILL